MVKQLAGAVHRALGCRRGAAMVEYVLLAALIALVAISAVSAFGTSLRAKYQSIATAT